jgi:hypothetical protein
VTYRVKDWDLTYETHDTRKLRKLAWVAVPNKHDGKGYRRMAAKGPAMAERLFAAWNGIIQLASRMPVRGTLADRDGDLTAEDMAIRTGLRAESYALALTFFSSAQMGWLENIPEIATSPEVSRDLPELPGVPGKSAVEQNRRELNRTEETPSPTPPATLLAEFLRIYPRINQRKGEGEKKVNIGERGKEALARLMVQRPEYPFMRAALHERKASLTGTARHLINFCADLPAEEELPALPAVRANAAVEPEAPCTPRPRESSRTPSASSGARNDPAPPYVHPRDRRLDRNRIRDLGRDERLDPSALRNPDSPFRRFLHRRALHDCEPHSRVRAPPRL